MTSTHSPSGSHVFPVSQTLRRTLKLPLKYKLIYKYVDEKGQLSMLDVQDLEILETYPSGMRMLRLTLNDGRTVDVLDSYFSDMQKHEKTIHLTEPVSDYVSLMLYANGTSTSSDLVELALIRYESNQVKACYQALIQTKQPISTALQTLLNLAPTEPVVAKDLDEVLQACLTFIDDQPVIGHHIGAMLRQINHKMVDQLGVKLNVNDLDLYTWAAQILPDLPAYDLRSIGQALGLPYPKTEHAIDLAAFQGEIYQVLCKRIKLKPIMLQSDLMDIQVKQMQMLIQQTFMSPNLPSNLDLSDHIFEGQTICVIGSLKQIKKAAFNRLIHSLKAHLVFVIDSKTDYVIAPDIFFSDVNQLHLSSEYQCIQSEHARGHDVHLMAESAFLELVKSYLDR